MLRDLQALSHLISLTLRGSCYSFLHSTESETTDQRGNVDYPISQSCYMVELELKSGSMTTEPLVLSVITCDLCASRDHILLIFACPVSSSWSQYSEIFIE